MEAAPQHSALEQSEKLVLIVDFGRIGNRTTRGRAAFDTTVVIHGPYIKQDDIRSAGCQTAVDFDLVLPRADVVCIHCPKIAATGMFNARRPGLRKTGAFGINTASGGCADEPDVHVALSSAP